MDNEELSESDLSFLNSSSSSVSSDCSFLSTSVEEVDDMFEAEADELAQRLYAGAELTVLQSYIVMMQYKLRHSLSKKAFSELIDLVALHLPKDAKLTQSLNAIRKRVDNLFQDVAPVKHYYCDWCSKLLGERNRCSNPTCTCANAKTCSFLEVPLIPQLKRRLQDPNLWNAIQARFDCIDDGVDSTISDVFGGSNYKLLSSPGGFLSKKNPANISLLMNTDGVAIFRSSSTSLWPIWIVINELPPCLRFAKSNMILGGVWYSDKKPTMNTYLRPFVDSLNNLYTVGFQVETPAGMQTCRAAMLMSALDLPARAIVANMKQFNGHYSCSWCEIEGENPPNLPMVSYFPHSPLGLNQRTHHSILSNAKKAITTNTAVKGIKGPTVLAIHKPFNLSDGFVVDALHNVFQGITKQLLSFWFSKQHAKKDFSLRKMLQVCEARLSLIKVPDFISRTPHLLEEFSSWKASECRSWILYYSIPVLEGILPSPYIDHYAKLVTSMHICFADQISSHDLLLVDDLLHQFYKDYEKLYGKYTATMNAHLLSHIAECVRKWGPLWAYSCFSFEGMNRNLKILFHGTRDMSHELATSYILAQLLPTLTVTEKGNVQAAATKFDSTQVHVRGDQHCDTTCLGQLSTVSLSNERKAKLSTHIDLPPGCTTQQCKRLSIRKVVYTSMSYTRPVKRCDYAVKYIQGGLPSYGLVESYLVVDEKEYFAIVQPFHRPLTPTSVYCQHVVPTVPASETVVIPVRCIESKCCYIDLHSTCVYFICPPNKLRFD